MLTKLNWNSCTTSHKNWVRLIKAKYLRGRRTLDFEQTRKAASWVWRDCNTYDAIFQKGACLQIGNKSLAHIKGDPWLPHLQGFRLPDDLPKPEQFTFVRDLMIEDGNS